MGSRPAASKKRPKTGLRISPSNPGHRRFRARQGLQNAQPLLRRVFWRCANVEEHATEVFPQQSLYNWCGNMPILLGAVAEIADN
jgi:hypothetical protein